MWEGYFEKIGVEQPRSGDQRNPNSDIGSIGFIEPNPDCISLDSIHKRVLKRQGILMNKV